MEERDHLIQGMTSNGEFRIIAARTTDTVQTARLRLDLSPVATDALGRAMTGALLLARLLEKHVREQRVTLRFEGGGPIGTLIAEGTLAGTARGYVSNPQVAGNGLDVGHAVGMHGTLTVIRGTPPSGSLYTSQIELVSGEVAKDLAQYLATSEQVTSAVLLSVLNKPMGVAAAGGLIVQSFPHASEATLDLMETKIRQAPPFSVLLDRMSIEDAVGTVLEGVGYKRLHASFDVPLRFRCSCSRERALAPLALFSREEVQEMIREQGGTQVVCQFCGMKYQFSPDDLLALTALPDA